ncbi:MAG: ABC transporter substrate-binding protein [Bacteroidales bacterium]|nr:ABC transporter substrate-binding protein [Bacteroidales bacterium]
MINKSIIIFITVLFFSCNEKKTDLKTDNKTYPKYAKGFMIENIDNYKKISINLPWQNASDVSFEYYLVNKFEEIPKEIAYKNIIITPIIKAVYLSSTYLGYIEALDKRTSIVGISGTDFVYDSIIRDMIINNQISEVGFEQNIDIEKIIELQPDVVFAYDINGSLQTKYETLQRLGIQVVIVSEYLENHPLGRAEWIKFFGAFFELDTLASSLFSDIYAQYNNVKNSVDSTITKPGVILNTPFQGIWYLPGGNSYMAQMINDAGGNYLFNKKSISESFSISIEEILFKNDSIDILLNPGRVNNISEIFNIDKRISNILCVKKGNVFNNNKRVNLQGGNDFWESGVMLPHVILKDLNIIFCQKTNFYDSLVFYKKLSL